MKWLIGILSFAAGIVATLLVQWLFRSMKAKKATKADSKATKEDNNVMSGLNKKERQELSDGILSSIGDNAFEDEEPITGNAYTGVDLNIPRREEDCIH